VSGSGAVRIGAAPDDDVVVRGAGVAPHHAAIVADRRGLILTVASACQRVYVNARAVQERAILHHGDTLALGDAKLLLTSDAAPATATAPPAVDADGDTGVAALRILSGTAAGTALYVEPELRMGAGTEYFGELGGACRVARTGGALLLEADADGVLVNGWPCRRAVLGSGDQIVLGAHRLLVEAPGLEYARHQAALPPIPPPVAAPPPARAHSVRAELGWLLLAAAMLAAIIALILYFHG
jgi:pSer/pThr/pTyr-binding forkhead associated (FHA) protein